jgi:TPR repeat protein
MRLTTSRHVALSALALLAGVAAGACNRIREAARCESGQAEPCRRDCERGDDRACEELTGMYLRGVGVEHSDVKAAALNKRLCESGRRYFCPSYAFVLWVGKGLPQDKAAARRLFDETCRYDSVACAEYGSLIVGGTNMPQDFETGAHLLDLACHDGAARACTDLRRIKGAGF